MLLNHVATGSLLKNKVRAVWTISGNVVTALILALPHLLSAQGSPLAVQPSTANVGIGTTAPHSLLALRYGYSGDFWRTD